MIFNKIDNKNMYISWDGNILKSYNKIIVIKKGGDIYINSDYYNYSTTTSRHRNYFLGVDSKEFEKNSEKGLYTFISDDEIMEMYKAYIK